MALKTVTAVSILVALLAQSAAAQDPAPGADPWSPRNVYYGATLVLAYADGNGKNFTPEQTKRFQLTVGWFVGMGQAITAMETLDPTPRGRRCLGHFEHLSPADMANKYATYWVSHPAEQGSPPSAILINAMYEDHPCS